jgi:hypothetical protein
LADLPNIGGDPNDGIVCARGGTRLPPEQPGRLATQRRTNDGGYDRCSSGACGSVLWCQITGDGGPRMLPSQPLSDGLQRRIDSGIVAGARRQNAYAPRGSDRSLQTQRLQDLAPITTTCDD